MTKEVKTIRNLKVIEQSGYRYQATPTVMLKGKWLSEFGFDIGTHVKVECEDGRLIITKEEAIEESFAKSDQGASLMAYPLGAYVVLWLSYHPYIVGFTWMEASSNAVLKSVAGFGLFAAEEPSPP